jgi:nucleotide-binding universal stress UspA family protein
MSKIYVGIDGSDHGSVALRWATRQGERHGVEVVSVFAWNFFDQGHREPGQELQPNFGETEARQVLDAAIAAAGGDLAVTALTIKDPAPEALVEAAGHDDRIVVGARGLGGFKGLLLGSVSQRVLELATCPVAVIHGEEGASRTGEIVVGFDGSPSSMGAVRWAAAHAAATGETVRIVHAWQPPAYTEVAAPQVLDALERSAQELAAEASRDPSLDGVTVIPEAECAGAAHALLAHDGDASMIVVANRGRGAIKRLLLGSTSRQVVTHSTVPVVVVPAAR